MEQNGNALLFIKGLRGLAWSSGDLVYDVLNRIWGLQGEGWRQKGHWPFLGCIQNCANEIKNNT